MPSPASTALAMAARAATTLLYSRTRYMIGLPYEIATAADAQHENDQSYYGVLGGNSISTYIGLLFAG